MEFNDYFSKGKTILCGRERWSHIQSIFYSRFNLIFIQKMLAYDANIVYKTL